MKIDEEPQPVSPPTRRPHSPPIKTHQLGVIHGCMRCRTFGGTLRPEGGGYVHFPDCERGAAKRPIA